VASNPLDSLIFIPLPEHFATANAAFPVDPAIPLPVQKQASGDRGINLEELTQEMILAGILTVLAYDRNNPWLNYYRKLLLAARPHIKQELDEAAVLKARDGDFEIAGELFASLRGLDPDDLSITLNTAVMLDQQADYYRKSGRIQEADASDEDALIYYRTVMNAEPPVPDGFFNAGFFYLKKQDFVRT
jgi:tetratricopeptide (TPR) repeat protein